MRKINDCVFDYACKDSCVKVANVKLVKKGSPSLRRGKILPSAHKSILRVPSYRAVQVRKLWCLKAVSLAGFAMRSLRWLHAHYIPLVSTAIHS